MPHCWGLYGPMKIWFWLILRSEWWHSRTMIFKSSHPWIQMRAEDILNLSRMNFSRGGIMHKTYMNTISTQMSRGNLVGIVLALSPLILMIHSKIGKTACMRYPLESVFRFYNLCIMLWLKLLNLWYMKGTQYFYILRNIWRKSLRATTIIGTGGSIGSYSSPLVGIS